MRVQLGIWAAVLGPFALSPSPVPAAAAQQDVSAPAKLRRSMVCNAAGQCVPCDPGPCIERPEPDPGEARVPRTGGKSGGEGAGSGRSNPTGDGKGLPWLVFAHPTKCATLIIQPTRARAEVVARMKGWPLPPEPLMLITRPGAVGAFCLRRQPDGLPRYFVSQGKATGAEAVTEARDLANAARGGDRSLPPPDWVFTGRVPQ